MFVSVFTVGCRCRAVEAASRSSCDGGGGGGGGGGARQGGRQGGRRLAVISGRQSGYLAGVWAAETGCGTLDVPWGCG